MTSMNPNTFSTANFSIETIPMKWSTSVGTSKNSWLKNGTTIRLLDMCKMSRILKYSCHWMKAKFCTCPKAEKPSSRALNRACKSQKVSHLLLLRKIKLNPLRTSNSITKITIKPPKDGKRLKNSSQLTKTVIFSTNQPVLSPKPKSSSHFDFLAQLIPLFYGFTFIIFLPYWFLFAIVHQIDAWWKPNKFNCKRTYSHSNT